MSPIGLSYWELKEKQSILKWLIEKQEENKNVFELINKSNRNKFY